MGTRSGWRAAGIAALLAVSSCSSDGSGPGTPPLRGGGVEIGPLPCAELDEAACGADARCVVQRVAAVDWERGCVGAAEAVGCAEVDAACPGRGVEVVDGAGRCFVLSAGCAPEGYQEPEAEGDACGAGGLARVGSCEVAPGGR